MAKVFTAHFNAWLLLFCLLLLNSCGTTTDQTGQTRKQSMSFFTGKFSWIYNCTVDAAGKTPLDTRSPDDTGNVAIIGDGWVLVGGPDEGQLYDLSTNGQSSEEQCIQKVRATAHERNLKTFQTITIALDETGKNGWTRQDVIQYEKEAIQNPALLQPIVTEAKNYDGVIADIETGNDSDPGLYTQYCKALKQALGDMPLGVALIHKYPGDNQTDLNGFQDWQALGNVATFTIIMALDEDENAANQPIVTSQWLKNIYDYALATLPTEKIMWELAGYCHLWGGDNSKLFNCNYDDVLNIRGKLVNKTYTLISENADSTLVNYTDEKGVNYYFADPRPVEMYTYLRKLTGSCITGSFYSLQDEDQAHTLSTALKQAGVFCSE